MGTDSPFKAVTDWIADSRTLAKERLAGYKPKDLWMPVGGFVIGCVAALGGVAVVCFGEQAKDALGGWKVLCFTVSVISGAGTCVNGLHRILRYSELATLSRKCLVDLDSLEDDIQHDLIDLREAVARKKTINNTASEILK